MTLVEIRGEGMAEPPRSYCLLFTPMFNATSDCTLTFQSPFAQLVAEIGRHLQVLTSDLSYSITKIGHTLRRNVPFTLRYFFNNNVRVSLHFKELTSF
jgi:hypothetical protein